MRDIGRRTVRVMFVTALTHSWHRSASIRQAAGAWTVQHLAPGILATLVLASLTWLTYSVFDIRSLDDAFRKWGALNVEPAPTGVFSIILADLQGDSEGRPTTALVEDALTEQPALHVVRDGRTLEVSDKPGNANENLLTADATGRKRLAERKADLLIWGRVYGDSFRLRFLSTATSDSIKKNLDEIEFSTKFPNALAAQIVAVAASSLPTDEDTGKYLVPILQPVAEKFRKLLEDPPSGLTEEQIAQLQFSYGSAAATLGQQTGNQIWFEEALAAFRAAIEAFPREDDPLRWAATQNGLGVALAMIGKRESGTKRLKEAVAAFRAALEARPREHAPLYWAGTQNNLGTALFELGKREHGTARLEEAVAAYRAALDELTREDDPRGLARAHSDLGHALLALGERERGTGRLKQAVAAYRAALDQLTREGDSHGLAWAHSDLGHALLALGGREQGTEHLEEAVAAYRAALDELTREDEPHGLAWVHMDLGHALVALGEREQGTERLEEAVAAYRAALDQLTREDDPHFLAWAHESGTARLEEAVTAYRGALEVLRAPGADYDIAGTQASLAHAEALLAKRRSASVAE